MAQQLAGEDILASDVIIPTVVFKNSTESVTSNIVLQNDDELFVALQAGKIYDIEAIISYSGAVGADLQTNWSYSGTITTNTKNMIGAELAVSSGSSTLVSLQPRAFNTAMSFGSVGGAMWLMEKLYLVTATAGTLQFMWAQVVSTASATSVLTASRMKITEMSF